MYWESIATGLECIVMAKIYIAVALHQPLFYLSLPTAVYKTPKQTNLTACVHWPTAMCGGIAVTKPGTHGELASRRVATHV